MRAVAPPMASTSTVAPAGITASGSYGRAVHSSPPIRAVPPCRDTSVRVVASLPTSAATPLRSDGGWRMWRSTTGRTPTRPATEVAPKTTNCRPTGRPSAPETPAAAAATASRPSARPSANSSATPSAAAMISHTAHASIERLLKGRYVPYLYGSSPGGHDVEAQPHPEELHAGADPMSRTAFR